MKTLVTAILLSFMATHAFAYCIRDYKTDQIIYCYPPKGD